MGGGAKKYRQKKDNGLSSIYTMNIVVCVYLVFINNIYKHALFKYGDWTDSSNFY